MNYCTHIFSLFFKRELRRKQFPIFAVVLWMWTKAASLHCSQSDVYVANAFQFYLCLHSWAVPLLCWHERHVTFVLILRYKSGLSFASTRPRLMLFETGNATSVDHHHTAVLSLLQHSRLLCAGLSSLQCCISRTMKWVLKTPQQARSTASHHWRNGFIISCREVPEWLVIAAMQCL